MSSEFVSYLFVPADSERKIAKAMNSATEAVIFDLEDGVAAEAKGPARQILRDALASWSQEKRESKHLIVRCNPVGSVFFDDDLALIKGLPVNAIMLPKCEEESTIQTVTKDLPEMEILPLVESARGVVQLEKIARTSQRVRRFAFGAVDFALDLGVEWSAEGEERRHALGQLVLLSRAFGLEAPVGAVFPSTGDQAAFEAEARREKVLGFFGKMIIHPRQVDWVVGVYQISPEQRAWSLRVVEAFESAGSGAIELDGKLIDLPVYRSAKHLLQR